MYDILILNGKIVSGEGNPWFYGDVAIAGDQIVKIGRLAREKAARIIDARGSFVSPGFIDGHSHSDLFLFADPGAEQKIMQGVTTENLGMDGMSVAPIDERNLAAWRRHLSGLTGASRVEWTWRSFADYLNAIDALPPSINVTSYVGLGTIRLNVMGMTDREARPEEIEQMKRLAAQAMEEGARGISTGLIYPPSQYQTVKEVVEIAKVVRNYDGIYDVHLRSEGTHLLQAMEEVIEIGKQSGIPVLITHFKINGRKNWGQSERALKVLDNARREGVEITIAQYPYTAGSTMLHAVIPPWFHTRGPENLIRMLREEKETIKKDIRERTDWENFAGNNGWENIVVSSVETEANKKFEGKNVSEVAAMRGLDDPADAALDLLAEEELAAGMIIFSQNEKDLVNIMRHPSGSFITDGLLGGKPHPRVYGAFPRILGRYVREQGILTLEEAVRKMTSLSAEKLRLKKKGRIAEGYDADITIFDFDTILDNATYADPRQFPSGVNWVIVNGTLVVEKGRHTKATSGRTIRVR
ncbi:MAG: D-aminoacylase [Deltaproteobacteria bacterium]|nr:MAG: D-aminoacylase [Deltaproteobacteria bacterium]